MKMNRKEEIALDFVDSHKYNDWEDWPNVNKLEDIYYNLVGEVYGTFSDNNMGDMTIEIDSSDRPDGIPYLFEIEYKEMEL